MIKTLDYYIIKKFLGTFFFTALILTLIAVVIDISQKVEDFIANEVPLEQIITQHYLNFIPWINGLLWPLFVLISVIFFTSRLASNSEIISIFNAGVSFRRLLRPYIIAALILCGLHLWANHVLIPQGNKQRVEFYNTVVKESNVEEKTNHVHIFLDPDTKAYIKYYRTRDTSARDFRLEQFEGNRLTRLLKADRAEWRGPPDKWRLHDYEIYEFDGLEEDITVGHGKYIDTTLQLSPQDFVWYKNEHERMTTAELKRFIAREKTRGLGNTKTKEVEVYRRTADTFTILILTILGMAVASRKVRGGLGLHLAIGAGLGAIYIVMSKFSITFATNQNLSPLLAVWIPNIIFTLVAIYLVVRAQK